MIDLSKTTSKTGCELYSDYQRIEEMHYFHGDRENWNLLFPVDGVGHLIMGKQRPILLNRRKMFLLRPEVDRIFHIEDFLQIHWVHFNLDAHLQYPPEWQEITPGILEITMDEKHIENFSRIFSEIHELCQIRQSGWYRLAYCLVQEIILRGNMIAQHGFTQKKIEQAARLLEPLNTPESMKKIAKRCSLSKTSFYRQFQNAFGISPGLYREQRIFNQAQALLEETDLTISEIADRLHFKNAAYFATRFKKTIGETPSQYRKMHSFQKNKLQK